MAKIFETQFEKGSLIDAIENRILTPKGTVILKRTDKGTASLFDGGISGSGARLESDFQITTIPFTVIVNFKFTKSLSTSYIVSQTLQNDPGRFIIDIQADDKLEFFLGGDSFKTNKLVNHKWYQAIFARDGDGVCRFYLNNEYLGTYTNNNAIPLARVFQIGGSSVVTSRVLFGYINKVIVYDGEIRTVQREKHYQEFLQSQPTEKPVRGFELVKPTDLSNQKDRGLLAAYNFKRNGDTLVDISGNGNNGTINGAVIQSKEGLFTTDTTSNVLISAGPIITTNTYSVLGRIKINDLMNNDGILFSNSNSTTNEIIDSIGIRGGKLGWNYDSTGTYKAGATTDLPLNSYVDFAFVSDGGRSGVIKLYINGVEDTITSTVFYKSGTESRLFARSSGAGFLGDCADFRIYNRALSVQEIKDYHNSFIKPVILEDFSNNPVTTTDIKNWTKQSGAFGIGELSENDSVLKHLTTGTKYLECTTSGTIKINHNTTTDADASIDYYDGASWATFSGKLSDLITTHAWLSKEGNYLLFTLTTGKAIANIKIYDGVRQ